MYAKIFKVRIYIHPSSQASPHIYSIFRWIWYVFAEPSPTEEISIWYSPLLICAHFCYLYQNLLFVLAFYICTCFVLTFVICTCFCYLYLLLLFVLAFVIYTYFWYLFFLLICTCFRFLHFSYLLFLYLLLSSRPPQNLLFTSSPSAFDLSLFSDHWPVSIRKEFTVIQRALS